MGKRATVFLILMVICLGVRALRAQGVAVATTRPAVVPEEMIQLNFPENLDIKTLVDYVSERLNLSILYDDQIGSQRLTLRTSAAIPKSSLLGLLENLLRTKGLAIVDADQPGWKRIVPAANLNAIARPTTQNAAVPTTRPSEVITQVLLLQYGDAQKVDQVIKPFLTQPGGSSVAMPEQRLLIITDYAGNLQRVMELIRLLDQPRRDVEMELVPARYMEASDLAQQASQLLAAKLKVQGESSLATAGIEITCNPRTNAVVVFGPKSRVAEVLEIIKSLDTPMDLVTKVYHFRSVSPERMDHLLRELLGAAAKRAYQSSIDREGNSLVVTATADIHQQLVSLQQDLDVPVAESQSPIRFYKLYNTTASDVLQTIRAIDAAQGLNGVMIEGNPMRTNTAAASFEGILRIAPPPPPLSGGTADSHGNTTPAPSTPSTPAAPINSGMPPISLNATASNNMQVVKTARAVVTADANTNTIIVVADPATQSVYEQMIRMLDKRRPQVLIECTLVTLDTSDEFSLGVELSAIGNKGDKQMITFSSFGLSTVNPINGGLAIQPGSGFNGTILDSDIGRVVLRALSTNSRSKVLSAPKILVNDNATGTLSSVAESPFTSVNASSTVSTTSFAGYAQAGTTITLTPHISEGDYLQLDYQVQLNAFTGSSSGNGIPPPRQTDSLSSKVTVPDGSMVIIGGLNQESSSLSVQAIPLLGQIPILEYLFSSRDQKKSKSTLFVFLRPIVLRDDTFEDLKYFSETNLGAAELGSNFPVSEPVLMR